LASLIRVELHYASETLILDASFQINVPNLTALSMFGCAPSKEFLGKLCSTARSLRALELTASENYKIESTVVENIFKLDQTKLEFLNLSGCSVSESFISTFCSLGFTKLEHLGLAECKIQVTAKCIESLSQLTSLKLLLIGYNKKMPINLDKSLVKWLQSKSKDVVRLGKIWRQERTDEEILKRNGEWQN
jgi:hypothetical protein